MYAIAIAFVLSLLVAMGLRSPRRHLLIVVLASGAVGLITGQLASGWLYHNPVHFRDVQGVLVLAVVGLALGAGGTAAGYSLHRLCWRRHQAEPAVGSAQGFAMVCAVVALASLAGPFVSTGRFGSAPLATIDAGSAVVLLALLLGWMAALRLGDRTPAVVLAVLISCIAVLAVAYCPSRLQGETLAPRSAWLLALASLGLLGASLADQLARLRARGVGPGGRSWRLALALVLPLLLLAGTVLALVTWSEEARTAIHPDPHQAFSPWAGREWAQTDHRRAERLQRILLGRMDASPRWWAQAVPTLLDDPDPALRFAAITAMRWKPERMPWPAGALAARFEDSDPRVRAAVLGVAATDRLSPPDDRVLVAAFVAAFSIDRAPSQFELEPWLGRERLVQVLSEAVATAEGRALECAIYAVGRDDAILAAVMLRLAGSTDPSRRIRCVDLLVRRSVWDAPAAVRQALIGLTAEPGRIGARAADALLRIDARQRLPVEQALSAALLLAGERDAGLMDGLRRCNDAQPAALAEALVVALAGGDARRTEGALRVLWNHGSGRATQAAALAPPLVAIIDGGDQGRALRAAAVALRERILPVAGRTSVRDHCLAHADPAVRLLTLSADHREVGAGCRLVREVSALLWADDAALRQETAAVIAQAARDPALAQVAMDASGQQWLREAAVRLRRP